jgi:hypothetical protein
MRQDPHLQYQAVAASKTITGIWEQYAANHEAKHPVISTHVGDLQIQEVCKRIQAGELMLVNSRRKNGLILGKPFHAEFAGPGAAVGGILDLDCQWILPVGNLSLLHPQAYADRQKAYLIRRQWLKLTQQLTDEPMPLERAHKLLNQFEHYFDPQTIRQLPTYACALLVGVFPQTIELARSMAESSEEAL